MRRGLAAGVLVAAIGCAPRARPVMDPEIGGLHRVALLTFAAEKEIKGGEGSAQLSGRVDPLLASLDEGAPRFAARLGSLTGWSVGLPRAFGGHAAYQALMTRVSNRQLATGFRWTDPDDPRDASRAVQGLGADAGLLTDWSLSLQVERGAKSGAAHAIAEARVTLVDKAGKVVLRDVVAGKSNRAVDLQAGLVDWGAVPDAMAEAIDAAGEELARKAHPH